MSARVPDVGSRSGEPGESTGAGGHGGGEQRHCDSGFLSGDDTEVHNRGAAGPEPLVELGPAQAEIPVRCFLFCFDVHQQYCGTGVSE